MSPMMVCLKSEEASDEISEKKTTIFLSGDAQEYEKHLPNQSVKLV